jgi:arylsulfatase A-like enzyme
MYDETILAADRDVQKVINVLKHEGIWDKTILILTSEHGEEFMEHGNVEHGRALYDELLRVPLIIHVPHESPRRVSWLVQGIDLMPTVLGYLNLPCASRMQGLDLSDPSIEKQGISREYIFAESFCDLVALRSEKWKYITDFYEVEELYDLKKDPFEKENVITEYQDVVSDLKKEMDNYFQENRRIFEQ